MRATDPTPTAKQADRRICPSCEATPRGCQSGHWLRGRWCCRTCTGNHDQAGGRNRPRTAQVCR